MTTKSDINLMNSKGSDRIQINNILSAVCIGALSVYLSLSQEKISQWILVQLAVAIPCLITSSLAYAKLCYRVSDEYHIWDKLGWITHSLGYIMIINSISILLFQKNYITSLWLFITATVFLFIIYSILDIVAKRYRLKEKIIKLAIYLVILFAGSIAPIIFGAIIHY